jgi:hypothetical protein
MPSLSGDVQEIAGNDIEAIRTAPFLRAVIMNMFDTRSGMPVHPHSGPLRFFGPADSIDSQLTRGPVSLHLERYNGKITNKV